MSKWQYRMVSGHLVIRQTDNAARSLRPTSTFCITLFIVKTLGEI
jgi:hypothetical protein